MVNKILKAVWHQLGLGNVCVIHGGQTSNNNTVL